MNWTKLWYQVLCVLLARHAWKRAVRIAGTNEGMQFCKRCGVSRKIALRPSKPTAPPPQ